MSSCQMAWYAPEQDSTVKAAVGLLLASAAACSFLEPVPDIQDIGPDAIQQCISAYESTSGKQIPLHADHAYVGVEESRLTVTIAHGSSGWFQRMDIDYRSLLGCDLDRGRELSVVSIVEYGEGWPKYLLEDDGFTGTGEDDASIKDMLYRWDGVGFRFIRSHDRSDSERLLERSYERLDRLREYYELMKLIDIGAIGIVRKCLSEYSRLKAKGLDPAIDRAYLRIAANDDVEVTFVVEDDVLYDRNPDLFQSGRDLAKFGRSGPFVICGIPNGPDSIGVLADNAEFLVGTGWRILDDWKVGAIYVRERGRFVFQELFSLFKIM